MRPGGNAELNLLIQRQHREIMELLSRNAVQEMIQVVAQNTTTFIKSSLNFSNIGDILKICETSLQHVTRPHRAKVHPTLWKEYTQLVKVGCCSTCENPLKRVHSSISHFITKMNEQILQVGCFPSTPKVDEKCMEVWSTTCDMEIQSNFAPVLELACEKLVKLFKQENERVLRQQKFYAEVIGSEVSRMYTSEMERLLKEGPVISEMILGIHTPLENKCLRAFDHAFLNTKKSHQCVWTEVRKKVEIDISRSFRLIRKRNDENLRSMRTEMTEAIDALKEKYSTDLPSFEQHASITSELRNLLEIEVKSFVLQEMMTESTWKSLQTTVDSKFQENQVDIMKQCAKYAAEEVNKSLPDHTHQWIQENMTPASIKNGNEFLTIFEVAVTSARENQRGEVYPPLWEEFCDLVEQECRDMCHARLLQIQEAILDFTQNLETQFMLHNYFVPSDTLDGIFHEAQGIVEVGVGDIPEVIQAVLLASSRLRNYFDQHNNSFVLVAESMQTENLQKAIINLYKEKMTTLLKEIPHDPDYLKNVHSSLLETCLECLEKSLTYFNEDVEARSVKHSQLRMDLRTMFISTFEKQNEIRLKEVQAELEVLVDKLEVEYKRKMKSFSRRHLEEDHQASDETSDMKLEQDKVLVEEMLHSFEENSKGKIEGGQEYTNKLKQRLKSKMESHWKELEEARNSESSSGVMRNGGGRLSEELKSLDSPRKSSSTKRKSK